MNNVWLKIKVWTKITIFALLAIFVLVFVIQNVNKPVTVWLWNDIPTTLLKVLMISVLISIVFTILVATSLKTVRQFKEMRQVRRTDRLEQEVADMRAKAAMLQTRPASQNLSENPVDPDRVP